MRYFVCIFAFFLFAHSAHAQRYQFFGTLNITPTVKRQYQIIEDPANPIIPIELVSKEDNLDNLLNYGIDFRYSVLNDLPILIGLQINYGQKNLYEERTSGSSFNEDIRIIKAAIPIIYQIGLSEKFKFNLALTLGSASINIETVAFRYLIQSNPDGSQTQISEKVLDERYTKNSFYYSPSIELQIKIMKRTSILTGIMYESFSIQTGPLRGKYKINGIGFRLGAGYSL